MKKQILLLALVITALAGGISIWLKLTGPELGIQLSESVKSDLKTENPESNISEISVVLKDGVHYLNNGTSVIPLKIVGESVRYHSTTNSANWIPVGTLSVDNEMQQISELCSGLYDKICSVNINKSNVLSIEFFSDDIKNWLFPAEADSLTKKLCDPLVCCLDGCSSWSGNPKQVRDSVAGISLKPACDAHDRCYYLGTHSAGACNDRFRDDLASICEKESYNVVAGVKVPDPVKYSLCIGYITTLYAGVVVGQSLDAYNNARRAQAEYERVNNCVSKLPPGPQPPPQCFLPDEHGGGAGKLCYIQNLPTPCCCPLSNPNCCKNSFECPYAPL